MSSKKAKDFYWCIDSDDFSPVILHGPHASIQACFAEAQQIKDAPRYTDDDGFIPILVGTKRVNVFPVSEIDAEASRDLADSVRRELETTVNAELELRKGEEASRKFKEFLLPWCLTYLGLADPQLDRNQAKPYRVKPLEQGICTLQENLFKFCHRKDLLPLAVTETLNQAYALLQEHLKAQSLDQPRSGSCRRRSR